MKKFLNSKTPLIIVILSFCILQVIFWPIVADKIYILTTATWLSYSFLSFAFIILGALTFIKLKSKVNFTAIIPIALVSGIYLFANLLTNVIIMAVNPVDYVASLVVNLILILLYAIVFVICYKHFSRVEGNTEVREARVASHRTLGVEVNSLIGIVDDEEINRELSIIKEDIDYSSSASTPATAEKDVEIREIVSNLNDLLSSNADREVILKEIKNLKRALKVRNQILMISR